MLARATRDSLLLAWGEGDDFVWEGLISIQARRAGNRNDGTRMNRGREQSLGGEFDRTMVCRADRLQGKQRTAV